MTEKVVGEKKQSFELKYTAKVYNKIGNYVATGFFLFFGIFLIINPIVMSIIDGELRLDATITSIIAGCIFLFIGLVFWPIRKITIHLYKEKMFFTAFRVLPFKRNDVQLTYDQIKHITYSDKRKLLVISCENSVSKQYKFAAKGDETIFSIPFRGADDSKREKMFQILEGKNISIKIKER